MPNWSIGDVSLSETLTDLDHLYPAHINELRVANNVFAIVDPSVTGQFSDIQEAIDFVSTSGGGSVLVKSGTYNLSDGLVIPTDVILIGENRDSVILYVPNNSTFTAHNGERAVIYKTGFGDIRNLTINGNDANNTQLASGIYLKTSSDNKIDNVKFTNVEYFGVYADTCPDVCVSNSVFNGTGVGPIYLSGSLHCSVLNNYINGGSSHGISLGNGSSDGMVSFNKVFNTSGFGISIAYDSNGCTIINNYTTGTTIEGINIASCQGGKILNNSVISNVSDYGISVFTEPGKSTAEHIQVSGNYVFQAYKSGIALDGGVWCSVTNNHIYNCVMGGALSNVKNGIHLTNTSIYCNVSNNTIIDIKSPITHVYGISEENSSDYNLFTYNIVKGYVTGAVNKTGGNSVLVAGISVTP